MGLRDRVVSPARSGLGDARIYGAPMSAAESAGHGGASFDPGAEIMHHILDAPVIPIHLGGFDLSITKSLVMMWLVSAFLVVLFAFASRRAKEPVPTGVRNLLEVLILFVRDEIARKNIAHGADRYVGFLATTFFFILVCNLAGLIPGAFTATGVISVTASLAIIAFLMIQWGGIREFGVLGHFKNLVPHGLPWWIIPLLIPVEILGMFAKPFALAVRLFANMTAGHVVIYSLIFIIFIMKSVAWAGMSVPFALFIYLLEILVAFLQAFIFTLLSALFIGMSVHPAH
jgi:F-type H+-transporting ATPase subunit a